MIMRKTRLPKQPRKGMTLNVSMEALEFLVRTTKGVGHHAIFLDLLNTMATEETSITKRGIVVPLHPCQAEASANALGKRHTIGRKPVTRILRKMEQLGLIRLTPSKLTSVANMTAVTSWTDNEGVMHTASPTVRTQEGQQATLQSADHTAEKEDSPQAKANGGTSLYNGTTVNVGGQYLLDYKPARTAQEAEEDRDEEPQNSPAESSEHIEVGGNRREINPDYPINAQPFSIDVRLKLGLFD